MDDFKLSKPKTSMLRNKLDKLKIDSALFIGSEKQKKTFLCCEKCSKNRFFASCWY